MSRNQVLTLPPPPTAWDPDASAVARASISAPHLLQIEPVNRHFLAHARRKLHNRTFSEDELVQAQTRAEEMEEETVVELEDEPESNELLELDPKYWKEQDHYAVLGLSKLRYKATPAQIKKAHRKKVLKHHPDKKAATGDINDDSFFKCIQKAYETLFDPVKRRQYDSIDPRVDDSTPRPPARPDQFFDTYHPVFEREARFSKQLPVPELGGPEAGKEQVNAFYDFWYSFDSWRSFEYLDKEEGDVENRDDKRHIEKKNKAERAKRKKEDTARLRKIVDQALATDPRIKRIKDGERAARDAKKREKEEAQRTVEEEAKKEEERKRIEKEKEEAEAKQRAETEKKDKEARKKAVKKERKTIKGIVKDTNYFCPPNTPAPPSTVDRQLTELDLLFEQLTLEETESLRRDLESHPTRDRIARDVGLVVRRGVLSAPAFAEFRSDEVVVASARVERVREETAEEKGRERPWTTEELALLIKAANKFPGGTIKRWEVIGDYVALHAGQPVRSQEELIRRSKEVKKGAVALDVDEKERLQHHKKHTDTRIEDAPTIRYDDVATLEGVQPEETPAGPAKAVPTPAKKGKRPAAMAVTTATATATATVPASPSAPAPATPATPTSPASPVEEKKPKEERPWTAEDQAALERALQAYPPSWKGEGDRWERIAERVEGRTKRECKARVKYLTEQVKAKKAAAQGK